MSNISWSYASWLNNLTFLHSDNVKLIHLLSSHAFCGLPSCIVYQVNAQMYLVLTLPTLVSAFSLICQSCCLVYKQCQELVLHSLYAPKGCCRPALWACSRILYKYGWVKSYSLLSRYSPGTRYVQSWKGPTMQSKQKKGTCVPLF